MTGDMLYRQYLSGDQAAGDQLMLFYSDTLTAYLAAFLKNDHDAEDLMLDCFTVILVSKPAIAEGHFQAYLFKMARRAFPAETDHLNEVLSFLNGMLDDAECGEKEKKQLGMAVEEIFVNIASYAYGSGKGNAVIRITTEKDPGKAEIVIRDTGAPYNPLGKPDPDLEMDVEQRQYGGFGIYMVKTAVDEVNYVWENGKNILTIRKSWSS